MHPRPSAYKAVALLSELHRPFYNFVWIQHTKFTHPNPQGYGWGYPFPSFPDCQFPTLCLVLPFFLHHCFQCLHNTSYDTLVMLVSMCYYGGWCITYNQLLVSARLLGLFWLTFIDVYYFSLHFACFLALDYTPDQPPDINSLDAGCLASK